MSRAVTHCPKYEIKLLRIFMEVILWKMKQT